MGNLDKLRSEIWKSFNIICEQKEYLNTKPILAVCKHPDYMYIKKTNCEPAICPVVETFIKLFTSHIRERSVEAANQIRDIVYMRDAIDGWTKQHIKMIKTRATEVNSDDITPEMVQHRGVGERKFINIILTAMGVADEVEGG
jgi:hypothetical protein